MSIPTLKDRILAYREVSANKLLRKLPVIINVNGRAFSRLTSALSKPFCSDFSGVMTATTIKLCHEIEGAVFAYTYNDDITIIARNDQAIETQPWFQNDIQKIVSASASIATLEFNNAARATELNLNGEATFTSNVFTVPNLSEAVNMLIFKQHAAAQMALSSAVFYELSDRYGEEANAALHRRTSEEKEELLNEIGKPIGMYPIDFRRGLACYRVPTLINIKEDQILKNKWTVNHKLPLFSSNQEFLTNILKNGTDVLRAEQF